MKFKSYEDHLLITIREFTIIFFFASVFYRLYIFFFWRKDISILFCLALISLDFIWGGVIRTKNKQSNPLTQIKKETKNPQRLDT